MEEKTLQNPQNEEQQQKQAPAVVTPPTASAVDVEAERAAAQKAERERCAEINALCGKFEIDSKRFIESDMSIDQVRAAVLEELGERNAPTAVAGGFKVGEDEADKRRAAYRDGFLMRAGFEVSKPADGANEMRHMSVRDIAMDLLARGGANNVLRMTPEEIFQRAMSTTTLPTLLSDITNAVLVRGYEDALPTYQKWARIGSLKDFRPQYVVTVGADADPVKIPENGEFTEAQLKESKKFVRLDTYGRSYSYTRQSFINDDQNVLTTIPYQLGQKFGMAINREAYNALAGGTYTANVNQGTAGAISTTTISEAMALLRKQKGELSKNYLRIMPRYLVVPVELEAVAAQFLRSTADPAANNSGVTNIYQGALTLISDPELSSHSADAWYLLGNQVMGEGVEVDFLRGNKTPILESQMSFETLGWKYRIYLDYGVKLLSTLGYVKNAGK